MPTELERLIAESGSYESFEANLEASVEHLVGQGWTRPAARAALKTGQIAISHGAPAAFANAKAQFDLIITRDTNTVLSGGKTCSLPFALFAPLDAESGYNAVLAGLIPAGVTLSNVQYSVLSGFEFGTKLVFTYTDGTHTDTVTVTCNQIEYPTFLKSINKGLFTMNKIRYTISDAVNGLGQFNNGMYTKFRTMFGKTGQDQISVGSWKDPKQFQNGIIDMDIEVPVNGEASLVSTILPLVNFQVTLSGFVNKLHKGNGLTAGQY